MLDPRNARSRRRARGLKQLEKAQSWAMWSVAWFLLAGILYIGTADFVASAPESHSTTRLLLSHEPGHQDDAAGETGALFSNIKNALPRKALDGTEVPKRFDPENEKYIESLAIIVAAPIILSVIIAFLSLGFCAGRFCCNSCGGNAPRREKYKRSSRTILTVFMVIILFFCLFSAAFGIWGTVKVSSSASDVFDTWIVRATDIKQDAIDIDTGLDELVVGNNVDLTDVINATGVTVDAAQDAKELYKANDIWRQVVNYTIFVFILLGALSGALAATTGLGAMSMCFGITSMILLIFIWLFVSIYFVISVAFEDVCVVFQDGINDLRAGVSSASKNETNTGVLQELLDALLECEKNGLPEADSVSSTELDRTVTLTNGIMDTSATRGRVDYVITTDARNITSENMVILQDEVAELTRSIDVNSNTPTAVPNEAAVRIQLDRITKLTRIQIKINGLKTCGKITDSIEAVTRVFCGPMLNAWDLVVGCLLVAGLVLMPGVCVGVRGKKRFPPQNLLRPGQKPAPKANWQRAGAAAGAAGAFAAAGAAKKDNDKKKRDSQSDAGGNPTTGANAIAPVPPLVPKVPDDSDVDDKATEGNPAKDGDMKGAQPLFVMPTGSTGPDGKKAADTDDKSTADKDGAGGTEGKRRRRRKTKKDGGSDALGESTDDKSTGASKDTSADPVRKPASLSDSRASEDKKDGDGKGSDSPQRKPTFSDPSPIPALVVNGGAGKGAAADGKDDVKKSRATASESGSDGPAKKAEEPPKPKLKPVTPAKGTSKAIVGRDDVSTTKTAPRQAKAMPGRMEKQDSISALLSKYKFPDKDKELEASSSRLRYL